MLKGFIHSLRVDSALGEITMYGTLPSHESLASNVCVAQEAARLLIYKCSSFYEISAP